MRADKLSNGVDWSLYYVNSTNSANPPTLLDLTASYTQSQPGDDVPFGGEALCSSPDAP